MFIHCNLYQQSQCHYVFFCKTSLYSRGWNSFGCWKKSMFLVVPRTLPPFFSERDDFFRSSYINMIHPLRSFFLVNCPSAVGIRWWDFTMRIRLKHGLNRAPSRLEDQFWGFWGWVSFEKWKHGKSAMFWVWPPHSNSDHQDYYIFSRASL